MSSEYPGKALPLEFLQGVPGVGEDLFTVPGDRECDLLRVRVQDVISFSNALFILPM